MSERRTTSEAAPSGAGTPTFVVGTAGHVDHGKSTLVKALTGIDPDRLAEEKLRQMTIDLGFAHLALPSGRQIGIVDVPGHERFIKNMLAGVGGIDAALLIVAADEGPMPQTREHLSILDLLEISTGIIVLTKRDAVDADWLDLIREEVRETVGGTTFADAPIVAVSALTGDGLSELVATLDRILDDAARPRTGGTPRLPIDRVFSVAGFGTVVTGTLLGGDLTVGQELRVLPADLPARIRGLQSHGSTVERARPGSRVAVNLAQLAVEDLRRGDVLTLPNAMEPTRRLDVELRLLDDAPVTLKQNDRVDLFVGAAEVAASLTLLDREQIGPGDHAWVQLRLHDPIAVLRGDRFILRRPSPSETIGGGVVINATPERHKRFRPEVVAALETLAAGTPEEIVLQELDAGPVEIKALQAKQPGGLAVSGVNDALTRLIAIGDAAILGPDPEASRPGRFVVSSRAWEDLLNRLRTIVSAFHTAMPLKKGMPKEELRSRLKLDGPARLFDDVVISADAAGAIVDDGQTVRRPDFAIVLDSVRRAVADRYLAAVAAHPFAPPGPSEFNVDGDTLGALLERGELVKVADGVLFAPTVYAEIERRVLETIDREGVLTLAGFRDQFQTSRKYAQATLEYLDQRRITRRIGDERVRFSGPTPGVDRSRTGGDG